MTSYLPRLAAAFALLTLAGLGAQAQPMYRIVGPDGRVTYSDRPPMEGAAPARAAGGATASQVPSGGATLPFELREIANRYPVTIYTAPNCAPCASARNLLVNRGVPFTERTVTTNEDIEALQRISNDASLPFGTIGGQQLKGFSDVEWTQYLDAAGYSKTSQLPPGYRQPPATPLVAVRRADETARPTAAAPAAPAGDGAPAANSLPAAPATPARNPNNPAGIRF